MRAPRLNTEERRTQIAEAALQIIAQKGLKDLTVALIARKVGVVPSAIYRHFDGKEDILIATLDLIRSRLEENVDSVCEDTAEPLDRLRNLLMAHIRMIREDRGIPRLIFSSMGFCGDPTRRERVYHIIQNYLGRIENIVKEGQKRELIRSDIGASRIAVMFLGMIQPGAILWHLSDGEFDVTKQARKAWDLFSQSIQPASQAKVNGGD